MSDGALTRLICKNSSSFPSSRFLRSPLHAFFFRTLLSSFSFLYVSPSPLSSQPLPFSGSPLRFCFVSGRPFIEDRTYFKNIKSVRSLLERHCFVCSLISSSNHPYQVSFSSFFIMIFFFFSRGIHSKKKYQSKYIFLFCLLSRCDFQLEIISIRRNIGWNWNTANRTRRSNYASCRLGLGAFWWRIFVYDS